MLQMRKKYCVEGRFCSRCNRWGRITAWKAVFAPDVLDEENRDVPQWAVWGMVLVSRCYR